MEDTQQIPQVLDVPAQDVPADGEYAAEAILEAIESGDEADAEDVN